jgi:hypothetical protein
VAGTRALALGATLLAALLAGCGDGDTTTVINQTTTTVASDDSDTSSTSTTTDSSTTTVDEDDDAVLSLKAFQSPSRNIACVATQKFVRCDISEREFTPPTTPADCQLDFGHSIQMSANGPASFVCTGDTVLNPRADMLPYGSSSRVGSITCESEESGIECENESGGSFSLSREEYDLN